MARAGVRASDSAMARLAGTAESSPAKRCQSAPGSTVTLPRGPMASIGRPGWTEAAQAAAGPSPCRTTSRSREGTAGSNERMV